MIRTMLLLAAISILLAGCGRQLAARDDEVCRSYGAVPGTPVYVQCRMHRSQQRHDSVNAPDAVVVIR